MSARQSVIIVLQTPTPIVYEVGGGLLCGWKGSSKDKGVQKKLSNLSKLPNFVKVQNTIKVDFQKDKRKKKDRLRKEVGALCKWRVFKEQKGAKRNYPTKLPHTTVKVENTHDELSILTIWPSCICFVDALDDDVA